MSAAAAPKPALRPYLPADAALLAEIFRASIEELAAEDYSEAQRGAWAAVADDERAFAARLARELTLVATVGGSPVGFVSLKGADHLDLIYVHPAVAGHGIGAMLCDAVERLAASRGTERLTADASDSARGFFEHRGYVAQRRNSVCLGDEWLANTTMEKRLADSGAPKSSATMGGLS
jgi:putative acetyltransferase